MLVQQTLNWARIPRSYSLPFMLIDGGADGDGDFNITAPSLSRTDATEVTKAAPQIPVTRYRLSAIAMMDGAREITMHFSVGHEDDRISSYPS